MPLTGLTTCMCYNITSPQGLDYSTAHLFTFAFLPRCVHTARTQRQRTATATAIKLPAEQAGNPATERSLSPLRQEQKETSPHAVCVGLWYNRRTQQKENTHCVFSFAVFAGSNVKIISGDYEAMESGWLTA